jgi:hypothetical protein
LVGVVDRLLAQEERPQGGKTAIAGRRLPLTYTKQLTLKLLVCLLC